MSSAKTPYVDGTRPGETCGVPCSWWPMNGRVSLNLPEWWLREQSELATPRSNLGMITEREINEFVKRVHGR